MKTLDYLQLNASATDNVVKSLQQLLADFQVYYTNLRGFHWNIQGPDFFVLHSIVPSYLIACRLLQEVLMYETPL
mgnify:CR=1 FL=1